ncbi:MAG: hypothetical protein VW644_10840 [Alphaproteobacteria bacterium]
MVHYFVNDADVLEPSSRNWLLRHSHLGFALWGAVQRLTGPRDAAAVADRYRATYAPDSPGFRAMAAALARLAEYSRRHDIGLVLAMTPDLHTLEPYPLDFIHTRMRELAATLGYAYVDLLPPFLGKRAQSFWAMPGDAHPNAEGHRLMADLLTPVIADMLAARGD